MRTRLPIFLLLALLLALFPGRLMAEGLNVVASIFPFMDFAREVGQDRVSVELLVPPGAEPHSWEPRPSDILKVKRADILIYNGEGMEPYIHEVLDAVKGRGLSVMEASRGLDLLKAHKEHHHGHHHEEGAAFDPHVWLDLGNDMDIVKRIAALFAEKDPAGSGAYARNSEAYIRKLKALDERFQRELSRCREKKFFHGGHAAFAYLARRYGLTQVALHGPNPDSEPTPREMARIVNEAREHRARVIFYEKLVNPQLAKVLAREAGARTLALDPAGNIDFDELKGGVGFLDIMERNLRNLKEGLGCE
jgi:zinc transport system substrate-binding protein